MVLHPHQKVVREDFQMVVPGEKSSEIVVNFDNVHNLLNLVVLLTAIFILDHTKKVEY